MYSLGLYVLSAAVSVVSVHADLPFITTSAVTFSTDRVTSSTIENNLSQRQIEDSSSTDFVDEMLNLFVQFIDVDNTNLSVKEDSKMVGNASEGRGMMRLKKFLLPFLLGVSVKTKSLILLAIGFLLVLTKITFIKSKIALVIGIGLLLYHLYVKKHAVHIKHALHHPVHYDVSPAWSAPLAAWAYPDWGAAAAATTGQIGAPYILRKTSEEHPIRFRRR